MSLHKSLILLCIVCFASIRFVFSNNLQNTGYPGDNFNLEGALDLFKNSSSLEEFERKLNTPDNYYNNLDLNGDGEVDYIKVVDYMEGNTHAIVLQTPVSETDIQDIAVITIEKNGDKSALIQIVGDEDLYGKERIVEPTDPIANTVNNAPSPRVSVNIWGWPSVRYIYAPGYVAYRPTWRWRFYPSYYRPWLPHPLNWHSYHAQSFKINYKVVNERRVVRAPIIYKPVRRTSVIVKNNYNIINNNSSISRDRNVRVNRDKNSKRNNRAAQSKNRGSRTGKHEHRGGRK